MKNKVLKIVVLGLVVTACGRSAKENNDIVITQEINMEHKCLNFDASKREGSAHTGKYYSSVDTVNQFAIGYEYELADSLKKQNLQVCVSAWIREKEVPIQGVIVVVLSTSKGTISWTPLKYKNSTYVPNDWVHIQDTVSFSSSQLNDSLVRIGVVGQKINGGDALDVDDLIISYKFSK